MMYIGQAFLVSLILTGILTIISGIQAASSDRDSAIGGTILGAISSFIVMFTLSVMILWWLLPPQTGTMGGYGWIFIPLLIGVIIFFLTDGFAMENLSGAGTLGAVALIVMCVLTAFSNCVIRSQDNVDFLASRVNIIMEKDGDYPDTDTNHIIEVTEQIARFKAGTIIGTQNADSEGNLFASTSYRVGTAEIQSIQDHLYWVFALDFTSMGTWNKVGQVSPGYIIVDAEDHEATPQLKLSYSMKYTPSAYMESKLERYLYTNGYAGYIIDDLSLEVDDEWKPFYTASISKKTLGNSGEVPVGAIVVDPSSGKIERYKIGETPVWLDRVYSSSAAKRMMNWWGNYGDKKNAPVKFWWKFQRYPKTARYEVADDPVLVYTKSGHPAWQMMMTSKQKNTSVVYRVLFDASKDEARVYKVPEGKAIATEKTVKQAFFTILENPARDYIPTHLSLHQIYGEPTWVANYYTESKEDDTKNHAGIAFLSAYSSLSSNVAFAKDKEEALSKYRQILAQNPSTNDPDEGSNPRQTVRGTIKSIATRVEGGNTVYVFVLSENLSRVFKAAFSVSPELSFAKEGDSVEVIYNDLGGQVAIDITSFNDLNIPIVP